MRADRLEHIDVLLGNLKTIKTQYLNGDGSGILALLSYSEDLLKELKDED